MTIFEAKMATLASKFTSQNPDLGLSWEWHANEDGHHYIRIFDKNQKDRAYVNRIGLNHVS